MPKGPIKERKFNRYGLSVYNPITKELLNTTYHKNIDEIADIIGLKRNTVRYIILKQNKAYSSIYDIYHIDHDNNRVEGLWAWKTEHKRKTEDAC